jgi:hypothetical protein
VRAFNGALRPCRAATGDENAAESLGKAGLPACQAERGSACSFMTSTDPFEGCGPALRRQAQPGGPVRIFNRAIVLATLLPRKGRPGGLPYCTAIVAVFDATPPIVSVTGTESPGVTPSGTFTFT